MGEKNDKVNIDLASEIASYNIDGKWNDYIGVQKNVIETLRNEKFFDNNTVTNDDSGMVIRITAKGIKETLGTGKRFQSLPRKLKELKIATLRNLPDIIKSGVVLHDDVKNYYSKNGDLFAYIESDIVINNTIYGVRVSIKKKVGSNVFWIHHIDTKKIPVYSTLHERRNLKRTEILK